MQTLNKGLFFHSLHNLVIYLKDFIENFQTSYQIEIHQKPKSVGAF